MERAILELSDKLRHPSDIGTKLDVIEKAVKDEYEQLEDKFRSKMADGYHEIEDVRTKIDHITEMFRSFRVEETGTVEILRNFKALVKDYKAVRDICTAHQRFIKIRSFIDNLQSAEESCACDNIEEYHAEIFKKEEFMYELEYYNDGLSQANYQRVEKAVTAITRASSDFTAVLVELASDMQANKDMLESLNRIVAKEEARDKLICQARDGDGGKDPEKAEIARMYPHYITRNPKCIKSKLSSVLKDSIRAKFNEIDTTQAYVNKLDFVLDNIAFIADTPQLEFFGMDEAITEYHKNLKKLIDTTVERLDAGEILALIEYKTTYYNTLEARYGRVAEAIGPQLIESEEELLETYAKTASYKLSCWIENITAIEIEKFHAQDTELSKDEEGHLVSTGFISLLQLIKVQLEPIAFNRKVFLYIAETVKKQCDIFKDKIVIELKAVLAKIILKKTFPGFEDYCILFGNSGLRVTQYLTSLPQYQSFEIRELGDTFMQLLAECNSVLVDYIFHVTMPAVQGFFTSDWDNSYQVFIVTLKDFLDDYVKLMADYSFTTLIYELCNAVVKVYVERLNSSKLSIGLGFGKRIKQNYNALLTLFSEYVEQDSVTEALSPLLRLAPILDSTSEEIILVEAKSLKLADAKVTCESLVKIINKRKDLKDASKKLIIEGLKGIFKEKPRKRKKDRFFSKFLPK